MQDYIELSATLQEEVVRTVAALKKGYVILYPTDTIWGLGCDPENAAAVKRVYEIKRRPESQPLVLLVDSIEMLKTFVYRIHPRVETLLMHHVQPLTIIYPHGQNLPPHLITEDGSIGIRVCKDPYCQAVIRHFGKPLISTSANISGDKSPTSFSTISNEVKEMSDYIVPLYHDDLMEKEPSIIATYNHKGELEFIRS